MSERLNPCLGSGTRFGRSQGGARWNNYGECPVCGKRIMITISGRLRVHGTRPRKDLTSDPKKRTI